jgi:NTP pyrophosphatase (non-canonical NTP hydrolase)
MMSFVELLHRSATIWLMDIKTLQQKVIAFRDERDWKQFHNPKDLAISLLLEAAEVLEHFQWKSPKEMEEHVKKDKDAIAEEIADTLYWILLMGHDLGIDLTEAVEKKMAKNAKKYPISKSKGSHKKYTEL